MNETPLAYWPCCGATVALTPRPGGYDANEITHLSHCDHAVASTLPERTP